MQDRPTIDELLESVALYLRDDVMKNTEGRTNFHGRVAANVVDMLRRELRSVEAHYAHEWDGLDHLLGVQPMPPHLEQMREALVQRNRDLSSRIREGAMSDAEWRTQLFAHLRRVIHEKISVSNPALAAEG